MEFARAYAPANAISGPEAAPSSVACVFKTSFVLATTVTGPLPAASPRLIATTPPLMLRPESWFAPPSINEPEPVFVSVQPPRISPATSSEGTCTDKLRSAVIATLPDPRFTLYAPRTPKLPLQLCIKLPGTTNGAPYRFSSDPPETINRPLPST